MIERKYTKDGLVLIHPSGVITITTLEQLQQLLQHAKTREKMSEQFTERISDDINALIKAEAV